MKRIDLFYAYLASCDNAVIRNYGKALSTLQAVGPGNIITSAAHRAADQAWTACNEADRQQIDRIYRLAIGTDWRCYHGHTLCPECSAHFDNDDCTPITRADVCAGCDVRHCDLPST